jgi:excisionase family DNA binding protein
MDDSHGEGRAQRSVAKASDRVTRQPNGQRRRLSEQGASAAARQSSRLTLTVEEAAALLGISRTLAYELVARGELPCLRLGRRVVISRHALQQMVDGAERRA